MFDLRSTRGGQAIYHPKAVFNSTFTMKYVFDFFFFSILNITNFDSSVSLLFEEGGVGGES